MAKRGSPLLTPTVLDARLKDRTHRTETDETPNADFDPASGNSGMGDMDF